MEHWPGVSEGVELAVLGARIDSGGHAAYEVVVEIPASEIRGQLFRDRCRRCGRAVRRRAFLKSVRACCVPRGGIKVRVPCHGDGLRDSGVRLRGRDHRRRWPKCLAAPRKRKLSPWLARRFRCCMAKVEELPRAADARPRLEASAMCGGYHAWQRAESAC